MSMDKKLVKIESKQILGQAVKDNSITKLDVPPNLIERDFNLKGLVDETFKHFY